MRTMIIISVMATTMSLNSYAMEFEDPKEAAAFEAIKPCSQEECARLQEMFNKKDCDQRCRYDHLKQLAKNFDIKKDGQFLRSLVCADKNGDSYMVKKHPSRRARVLGYRMDVALYPGFREKHTTLSINNISFLNHAIAQNNIWFMKTFFKLFNHAEPIADFEWRNSLHFRPREAVKASAEMTQLLYEKIEPQYDYELEEICESKEKNKYPGCHYYIERLRAQREWQKKEQQKQEQESKDKKQKWEQELRDVAHCN